MAGASGLGAERSGKKGRERLVYRTAQGGNADAPQKAWVLAGVGEEGKGSQVKSEGLQASKAHNTWACREARVWETRKKEQTMERQPRRGGSGKARQGK